MTSDKFPWALPFEAEMFPLLIPCVLKGDCHILGTGLCPLNCTKFETGEKKVKEITVLYRMCNVIGSND